MVCGAAVPSVGESLAIGLAVVVSTLSPDVLFLPALFHPVVSSFSSLWLIIFAMRVVFLLPLYVTPHQPTFKLPGVGTTDTTVVMKPISHSRSIPNLWHI